MKLQITCLLVFFIFQSCDNKPEKKAQVIEYSYDDWAGCYGFVQNKDSILMSIKINGDEVSGLLIYNFYEKDDNKGSFVGQAHGDTIFAMYHFDSEGKSSTREIAFLKRGNELVEGFGEIEEKNGKMTFKNRRYLNFDSNIILSKTDCNEHDRH